MSKAARDSRRRRAVYKRYRKLKGGSVYADRKFATHQKRIEKQWAKNGIKGYHIRRSFGL
jgi:hypothetical protein